jgi:AcrR family transcriptional regulator
MTTRDNASVAPAAGRARPGGDQRRQDLVQAAYGIIAAEGFEGLRVRDVAARAGVNIATLHYYFHTKEDLIRGVVDLLLQRFLTQTAPAAPAADAPGPAQLAQVFADPDYQLQTTPEMFVVLTELHLRAGRDPAIRALLQPLDDGWRAHLTALCAAGQQAGTLRPDQDPARTAALLIALVKGLSLQAISGLPAPGPSAPGTDLARWLAS